MKTGIIGLPQVGKTSLFKILTKAKLEERGYSNPREAHIGVARVPDERLDKLSALYSPKKTTFATVEYVDVAAIGQEALKETAFLTSLRNVDALIHVLRAFEDDSIPHVGPIDPLRDIKNVEFDLMVSDLTQIEKRLERVEKDLKKGRTGELEREQALLLRSKEALEKEQPLRELEMTAEEKKLIKGFMFLSQKPILYALNIGESTTLGDDLDSAVSQLQARRSSAAAPMRAPPPSAAKWKPSSPRWTTTKLPTSCPATACTRAAWCGSSAKATSCLASSASSPPAKTSAAPGRCRWAPKPRRPPAPFTPISNTTSSAPKPFAGTQLLDAGSEAAARARGTLRLEGKEYIVQDGDVMHIRHSG